MAKADLLERVGADPAIVERHRPELQSEPVGHRLDRLIGQRLGEQEIAGPGQRHQRA